MSDLATINEIYDYARDFMRKSGNHNQWGSVNPTPEEIERDIETGRSFVCVQDGEIATVFYFNIEIEPTYGKIDGSWLNDEPYGVVHRIARADGAKGTGAFCLNWCFEQCHNLRIDTHRDNAPMISVLNKLGFGYCGIIWVENGDERLAFQRVR